MRMIIAFLTIIFSVQTCFAWSEGGHHLIAVMAFDLLQRDQQQAVLDLLKAHPRFDQDFRIPDKVSDPERYLIGRAAYWPDVARSQKQYNRPTWHYQLGSALTIGDVSDVPSNPGPCPPDATLETQDLHIAQAIELCRRILRDRSQAAADRAIALCWIGHLVGDSHQPCHSGSLYCRLFPEGDRGANSIPTAQSKNMHALWDGLLGPRFDEGDIRRRQKELEQVGKAEFATIMIVRPDALIPSTWLAESVQFAKDDVYDSEVLDRVKQAQQDGTSLGVITLSEQYLTRAGKVAQFRAIYASQRLSKILAEDIGR